MGDKTETCLYLITHHLSPITVLMSFSTRITVRFGDTDPAGLVYYRNIFHYFHIALEEFFAARWSRLMVSARQKCG